MNRNITILNFDQVYRKQNFYQREEYNWLDVDTIANTNLLCTVDSLAQIEQKLKEQSPSFLTYIGSGNYHYVTYLFLSRIQRPFTLILFDHHTDTHPSPSDSLISCGSWVLDALQRLPQMKKVIVIGARKDGKLQFPFPLSKKIQIFTEEEILPSRTYIFNSIPTESVYISIDKDVLRRHEAITSWDQGVMSLKQVATMLKWLFQLKDVIGVDVCGEYPLNPTNERTRQTKEAMKKNNAANAYILKQVKEFLQGNHIKLVPQMFAKKEKLSHQS